MESRPKLKISGKTVATHRHVWEQANGPIPDGYEVHHKDHDRFNNELSNLELMTAAAHRAHHAKHNTKHPKEKECRICLQMFTPSPTKRARAQTCSPECLRELLRRQKLTNNAIRRISQANSARIRERASEGERPSDLAVEYGVSKATITYHLNKGRR